MKEFVNKLYCIDNLELLKQLPSNSIDLIYCDILYNTGKKFKDYDDNLGTPQEAIEWYKPRLIEMKRVLKDTGSIWIHCDSNLSHYLKVEMDNIFPIFINEIIWQYPKGIKNSTRKEINNHDTIFRYGKTNNYTHNVLEEPYTKDQLKRFKYEDEYGRFYWDTRRDKDNNKIRVKVYLKKNGTPLGDVWYFNFAQGNERVGYDTQKPIELLKRIILSSSNENDIVADFFMGSGTTIVATKELNRNYIGCDINSKSIEITKKRLKILLTKDKNVDII